MLVGFHFDTNKNASDSLFTFSNMWLRQSSQVAQIKGGKCTEEFYFLVKIKICIQKSYPDKDKRVNARCKCAMRKVH